MGAKSRQSDGEKPKRKQTAAQLANLKGGSRKGIPNKLTRQVKEMILDALDRAGGVDYLVGLAEDEPKAFAGLIGRVLPLQLTGEGGGAILHEVIRNIVDARQAQ
jgi:hypothetical protein